MGYLGKIQDTAGNTHLIGSTLYGTCSTPASGTSKGIVCSDFDSTNVPTGLTIRIKFTYGNTANNPTLQLGNTSYTVAAPSVWNAGDIVAFTFDGTYWQISGGIDSTKLPLSGGTMTGDITLNSNKIYLGNNTDDVAYIEYNTDSQVAIVNKSGRITLAPNGVVINPSSGSVEVDGTLTATTLSNTRLSGCSLSNTLSAGTKSITFGTSTNTGVIQYVSNSGLTLSYQGSSISIGSSYPKIYGPGWPTGTGTAAVIGNQTANLNTIIKSSSSRRYKDDIVYDLDKEKFHSTLMQMKPCQFHYKSEPDLNQYGFIAEDIAELDTKLCLYENDQVENYLDRGVLALIVTELQRKDKEIEKLKERIEKLENKGG